LLPVPATVGVQSWFPEFSMRENIRQLSVRHVTEQDRELLLDWANDPQVRRSAFSEAMIGIDAHNAWFYQSLADTENCSIFIVMTEDGQPVGQTRFNRKEDGAWHIDYSVAPAMRGQGLGSRVLMMGLRELDRLRGAATVVGWVKAGNDRSSRVFENLGFELVECTISGDMKFQRAVLQEDGRLICIATPHARNDGLVERLSAAFPSISFRRIVSPEELKSVALWTVRPDWIFFPHWSWIIPEDIYANFRCVIFHMTDLPYGRGGSPLQNLIVRGHKATKISAIVCSKGLDTGDIYRKRDLSLEGTAEQILVRASDVIEEMIRDLLEQSPVPEPQNGEVTIFARRTPADGDISGLTNTKSVYDYIRMLDADGYPRAFANIGAIAMEFSEAELKDGVVEARVRIKIRNDAQ
jgi:methionyl-tRNA formyltransferase